LQAKLEEMEARLKKLDRTRAEAAKELMKKKEALKKLQGCQARATRDESHPTRRSAVRSEAAKSSVMMAQKLTNERKGNEAREVSNPREFVTRARQALDQARVMLSRIDTLYQ
jgi:hypothetical protein